MTDFGRRSAAQRAPTFGKAAIATSHTLASSAGAEMLLRGGNAVDAAIAAAMTLTVVEPSGCGIGSDAFAILWDGERLHGLDASGRSPRGWSAERFAGAAAMPESGWNSVTVPGAVSAWAALSARFGRLTLEEVAAPAIRHARDGFHVTPTVARLWTSAADRLAGESGFADCFLPGGRVPATGEIFRAPGHADTLEQIAATNGEAFYRGALAEKIVADARAHGAALDERDLGEHAARWVAPLGQRFGPHMIYELPPAGQGVASLMALGMLDALGLADVDPDEPAGAHLLIEATKLALADLYAHVGDPEAMEVTADDLLHPDYLRARAGMIDWHLAGNPSHGKPGRGGTVCLSTADASGMMVSFIQSNYMGFGSGVVVPGTGISLQNRGAGFSLTAGHPNRIGPGKLPFHTIIPGFATDREGAPVLAFGLMGGPMQAQGHVQMVTRILGQNQDPQAAADAPRWRVTGGRRVAVEASLPRHLADGLALRGHEIVRELAEDTFAFGGAQAIRRIADGYVAGSDPRKDGIAIGL